MKKSLFLSLAALAFAGSASAQTAVSLSTSTPPIPAANAVTATPLLIQGIWQSPFAGTGNTYNGTALKMTTTGTYQFEATSSNWTGILSSTWNTLIAGSIFDFTGTGTGTDISFAETTNTGTSTTDGISALLADNVAFDLTISTSSTNYATPSSSSVSFLEHIIKKGGTGVADDLGCGTATTIKITPVAQTAWKTGVQATDLTVNKTAICQTAVAAGKIIAKAVFADNANITKLYAGAKLEGPSGSTILFTDNIFTATPSGGAGTLTFDVFDLAQQINTGALTDVTKVKAGKYTLTVDRGTDDIAGNATNSSSLGIRTGGTGVYVPLSVDFAILPSPTPTLTTATVQ